MVEKMNFYSISHIGNSRDNQEDNLLLCNGDFWSPDTIASISHSKTPIVMSVNQDASRFLLAVSDGMGGHSSGEVASYLTVKYLSDNYSKIVESDRTNLLRIISELNRQVSNESQNNPSCKGMGATLCGVIVSESKILGFNVGDSRLYRYENGKLSQLSKDHSEGQRLLDLNLLTKEELKSFPNRKAIYKYIGMKTDLVADVFDIEQCEQGNILLLCTDGLTDVLADFEMQEILNTKVPLKEKGEKLLNTAIERNVGHGDNITIILTEF